MKKFYMIILISFLIFFTAIIKNSTKKIDDEIFETKENLRGLKKELENIRLEHDYLSSSERLIKYQSLYFENELIQKKVNEIVIIDKNFKQLNIKKPENDKK
tara:strand:- start:1339 stop:1644 length:306 start_codon:yes stop_codon:yes gene_type:complete